MGAMKLVHGWLRSNAYIPREIQVFAGLVQPRDPEAWKEKRRAEKEAAKEREAIRAEATFHRAPATAKKRVEATKQGELFRE